jgi:hypothetical protein
MKVLGDRYDYDEGHPHLTHYSILEVTRYELELIEKMLAAHDIDHEEHQIEEWKTTFRNQIHRLNLSGGVSNALCWAVNMKDFADDTGRLYSFEEWLGLVQKGYRRHGDKGFRYEPFAIRNFGKKSYAELIAALESSWQKNGR